MLVDEKEIIIKDKKYLIGKIPVLDARRIFCQYVPSMMPKLGSYELNHQLAVKLLSFSAAYDQEGKVINLINETLINNHVPDLEISFALEFAIAEYNVSFLERGRILNFFQDIVQNFQGKTLEMLTRSLQSLFQKNSQPTAN